jgi:hypothetical protein
MYTPGHSSRVVCSKGGVILSPSVVVVVRVRMRPLAATVTTEGIELLHFTIHVVGKDFTRGDQTECTTSPSSSCERYCTQKS